MNQSVVPIKDVYFGKLDAYSEYLEYGQEMYQSLFYSCPEFHIDRFLDGKAYYIYGDKGTGKTALLKHIDISASKAGALVEYIRFKKDIDDEERNAIKRAGIPQNAFEEVIDKDIPNDVGVNCIYAWQVYIIKTIISRIEQGSKEFFVKNDTWKKLKALITGAYKSEQTQIKRILPKLKRGNLKLDIPEIAELGLDFEWDEQETKTISFISFAKQVIGLFSQLVKAYNSPKCYILFDELELLHINKKMYLRDTALIRDLIQAIYYINEISKKNHFQISVISCIRNEVYRSVQAVGYEINKLIRDYGVEISWQMSGGAIGDHPLIKMLLNRLVNSQPKENRPADTLEIWSEYFDERIDINYPKQTSMNYIIDQTWNKPRDLIRLFTLIQERFPSNTKIDTSCFEAVRKKYSSDSWEEFSNELSAKYTQDQIDGIKKVLIGIGVRFSLGDFAARIKEKSEHFDSVDCLCKKPAAEILEDLYRIGIIGTEGRWPRFYFKGDEDFDSAATCVIHYPLRRFFSV